MTRYEIKQNDTNIVFNDFPSINGVPMTPAQLVGCTVAFLLSNQTVTPPISINQAGTINTADTPSPSFNYSPVPSDVSVAGTYRQEWQLTFPNGKELTFPNNSYNVVEILPELG
jgi:hypothetical protein